MTVGDRIRQQRELKQIPQIDLAEKINISKQLLYKYEMNVITNIPSDRIEKIAKALSVSPAYLMGWEDTLTTENANLIPDILSDQSLLEHIKMLKELNHEHKQTIFNNITYWYEKAGH